MTIVSSTFPAEQNASDQTGFESHTPQHPFDRPVNCMHTNETNIYKFESSMPSQAPSPHGGTSPIAENSRDLRGLAPWSKSGAPNRSVNDRRFPVIKPRVSARIF